MDGSEPINDLMLRQLDEWPEQMRKWGRGPMKQLLSNSKSAFVSRTHYLSATVPPQPKQSTRFTVVGHAYTDPKKKRYVADLVASFRESVDDHFKPFTGRLRVTVIYSFAWRKSDAKIAKKQSWAFMDKRPDIDNLFKPVADAMQAAEIINDDGQICEVRARKIRSGSPGIFVKIEQISEHI